MQLPLGNARIPGEKKPAQCARGCAAAAQKHLAGAIVTLWQRYISCSYAGRDQDAEKAPVAVARLGASQNHALFPVRSNSMLSVHVPCLQAGYVMHIG